MNDPERQDGYYMQHVLELAERALEEGEFPIASIVVLGGEVIATAATAERREGRFLVHAEYEALLQADRLGLPLARRRAAALYANLEPCLMCLGAAMTFSWAGSSMRSSPPAMVPWDWCRAGTGRETILPSTACRRWRAAF
jgi:tRNA(Arg) A34 adenosine deaminase TadA